VPRVPGQIEAASDMVAGSGFAGSGFAGSGFAGSECLGLPRPATGTFGQQLAAYSATRWQGYSL